MILYIAGPYRGDVDANIQAAREAAISVWEAGHFALCPHLNTAHFELDCRVNDETYIERDLDVLVRCDGIIMLPGWEESAGAETEHEEALRQEMPVWYWPEIPERHPTERACPRQVRAFAATLGRIYRLHLRKNADYSPANILATGEIGLMTRLWDKTARLLNLYGWRIQVAGSRFEGPREAANESIEDSFIDAAAYAVIGLLLRKGEWGR